MANDDQTSILNTYKRFPLTLTHGKGSKVFDTEGKEYLDFTTGIAVNSLGHCHPQIVDCIKKQSSLLLHVSNLYYNQPQIDLADKLVSLIGPGKIFYSNSGAEANECLIKLARSYGSKEGRSEIITMENSFHGRTMAGISATGQDKVKKSFYPLLPGFKHVPFNDIQALEYAIGKDTIAIMLEGIQGEGGIIPATPEYLIKVRSLCNKHNLLLFVDAIQCGFYRTGNFQSYTSILGEADFLPDGISMAKGLGAGLPIGASWINEKYTEYLPQGSHGSTFSGNPLVTKVALTTIEIIEKNSLLENINIQSSYIRGSLEQLQKETPGLIKEIRGLGLLLGIELESKPIPEELGDISLAGYVCYECMKEGLLLVPAGLQTVRLVPSYIVTEEECEQALAILKKVLLKL